MEPDVDDDIDNLTVSNDQSNNLIFDPPNSYHLSGFSPSIQPSLLYNDVSTSPTRFTKSIIGRKKDSTHWDQKSARSLQTNESADDITVLGEAETKSYSSQSLYKEDDVQDENYGGEEYGYDYSDEGTELEDEKSFEIKHKAFSDMNSEELQVNELVDESLNTTIYAAPMNIQPRRHKSMTRRQVELVHGNLILDCPVPTKLSAFLPCRDKHEYLFMRYSAVTCDPDDFSKRGFSLRSSIAEREIQLCICITMYNEDEKAFTRTMHAVMKNVAYLCSRNKSRVWGKDGWKKVQVVIISDGRSKISPGVLDVLAAMGVYQEGIAKSYVNSKEVKAHLFEYTTQVSIGTNLKFKGAESGLVPVQILFCLKEKNTKKINSHRWLFNGICPGLSPNVCILLDVGTKPAHDAVYNLWKAFDIDSNVAGAAGEIKAIKGTGWVNLLNPLVAAQNFEYKMSNILDKPLESVFGYVSVLPGALSAYRYRALANHPDGTGPLNSYFKGESLDGVNKNVFEANMYLAEDRILCWELVAKKNESWVLKYVKNATGETDVPDSLPEFISQRRRWLNGALFAALYSLSHFKQTWSTDHSIMRKIFLHVEFIYQFVQLIFSFFSLANFYLAFYFLAGSISGNDNTLIGNNGGYWLFIIFKYICLCDLAIIFILSMGNRPQGAKNLFLISLIILIIVYLYATGCGLYFVIKTLLQQGNNGLRDSVFINIVISLLSTYGIYGLMSLIYLDPWHFVTCSVQYIILVPLYVCTLQIYAYCNTHDVSWGTKGDNSPSTNLGSAIVKNYQGKDIVELEIPSEQVDIDTAYDEVLCLLRDRRSNKDAKKVVHNEIRPEDYYRKIRTNVLSAWLIANILLIMVVCEVYQPHETGTNIYLKLILWSVAGISAFKAIGSLIYLLQLGVRYVVKITNKIIPKGFLKINK